jgi:hypothetical protein
MSIMRTIDYSFALLITLAIPAQAQSRIDSINTNFRWLGQTTRGPAGSRAVSEWRTAKLADGSAVWDEF